MNGAIPEHLEELYSKDAIAHRVTDLARELDRWSEESLAEGRGLLLAVCVLRGGVFFFSDLLQKMSHSVEPSFCRAWSYVKGINSAAEASVRVDWINTDVGGRDVLLIDNICDSGRTLDVLAQLAREQGAQRVRTVTLVHRIRQDAVHTPSLAGFTYDGPEWLVGYGLRDGELRSNLPCVCRLSG